MSELRVRVQWAGGFVEASDGGTGPVRTIPYNAGDNVRSAEAAQALAEAYLTTVGASESVSSTLGDVDVWPAIGDAVSTYGFDGTLQTQRIRARRVDVDRNGFARVTPTLGSPAEEITARQQLAIQRMATGSTGGRSAGIAPSTSMSAGVPSGPMRQVNVPEWSWSAFAADKLAGPIYDTKEPGIITKATGLLTASLADDVIVDVLRNGVTAAALTIATGEVRVSALWALRFLPGESMQCVISSLGSLTEGDLAGVKLTMQFKAAPALLRVQD